MNTLEELDTMINKVPVAVWKKTAREAREAARRVLIDARVDPERLRIPIVPFRSAGGRGDE